MFISRYEGTKNTAATMARDNPLLDSLAMSNPHISWLKIAVQGLPRPTFFRIQLRRSTEPRICDMHEQAQQGGISAASGPGAGSTPCPPPPMARQLELAVSHIRHCLARIPARPLFVGLQGPQGSGKTFLCSSLAAALTPLRAAVLSIDDLYLPHAGLRDVAARYPNNTLLAGRGQPGTHDLALGVDILEALRGQSGTVRLPGFDKSLHGGEGDRVEGIEVNLPTDVVVVEGWCTGFYPLPDSELDARNASSDVREINGFLRDYADKWWSQFHAFIQVCVYSGVDRCASDELMTRITARTRPARQVRPRVQVAPRTRALDEVEQWGAGYDGRTSGRIHRPLHSWVCLLWRRCPARRYRDGQATSVDWKRASTGH